MHLLARQNTAKSNLISEIWNEEKNEAFIKCVAHGKAPLLLISMREGGEYKFFSDEKELKSRRVTLGAYEVELPLGKCEIHTREV